MSNLYPSASGLILAGDMDLVAVDLRVIALDSGYVYNNAHNFRDDITAGFIVATSPSLTGKTTTAGVFDAADTILTAVSGDTITQLVIYQHTGGASSTDPLVAHINGFTSIVPNGEDITIQWDNTTNRIFRLPG